MREVTGEERSGLEPLFAGRTALRAMIDSVLANGLGRALAIGNVPDSARLDLGVYRFLAGARQHSLTGDGLNIGGPVFAIFVIAVAAVEAAVGLALVIALYRRKQTVSLDLVDEFSEDDGEE